MPSFFFQPFRGDCGSRRFCLSVLLIACVSLSAPSLAAQTFANWQAGLGSWTTPSNWDCGPDSPIGCVPNSGTTAAIGNGGTATLNVTGSAQALEIGNGGPGTL